MNRETAQQTLDELQLEIAKLDQNSPEIKVRLQTLATKVEQQLSVLDEQAITANLLEQLEQSVEEFEVEHPQITDALSRILYALSNMGI